MTETEVPKTIGAIDETGTEIPWDKAAEYDVLDSKFFKPQPNVEYRLTFSASKLLRKLVQDFNDKNKKVEATVLELKVSSINGQPVNQEWNVRSFNLRAMFEPYAKANSILKKTFMFKVRGQGTQTQYTLAAID